MNNISGKRVGAIILAAGRGQRMGRNKMLLPIDGKPMVLHIADAIAAAGLGAPVVAMGHEQTSLAAVFVGRPHIAVSVADYASGMGQSLASAVAHAPPDWDAAFICLGDMPYISAGLLRGMSARADPLHILIPQIDGQNGNPVLWGRHFFGDLVTLQGDMGGRQLFARHLGHIRYFETSDAAVLRDLDRPEDVFESDVNLS